jgi:hypothetical protein
MIDKLTQLVLDGLSRAAAEPAGSPLHGSKGGAGLFPGTAPGKQAAQRCKDQELIQVIRTEPKGKTTQEICGISEKGLAYLLEQVSPKQVLGDLVRALEARQGQVDQLLAAARSTQGSFADLKTAAEKVLRQVQPPTFGLGWAPVWMGAVLDYLAHWQETRTSEDCSLPELYHQAREASPNLTIGHFHDGLRQLHDREQIYLHPWTGPLYEIPQPPYALLVGHEIAYYASRRPLAA